MIAYRDNETADARILSAEIDRQTPYPSPESIIAQALADCSPPTGVRRKAHQITRELRAAGWRILR